MTGLPGVLESHRADGPLARVIAPGRLPLPEVALLPLAVAVVLWPIVARLLWEPVAQAWVWVAVGWVLAMAARLGRPHPRLSWPIPALLRALEYTSVLVLVWASPWSYALVATVAFHHYDIVYRQRTKGVAPPRWLVALCGGWEGRMAVLLVAAAGGAAEPAAAIVTLVLAPVLVVEAIVAWATARTTDEP